MDLTTKSGFAEIHPTYRCNLSCVGCNRMCFLKPSVPDMTIDDMREFLRQAKELHWSPIIRMVGGEPTLHANFMEFLELAQEFTGSRERVQIWSNAHGKRVNEILDESQRRGLGCIMEHTKKPMGTIIHGIRDFCIAPADYGEDRQACGLHSSHISCGICVDSQGYALCPCGGAIAGYLDKKFMTKTLADLFNQTTAETQTKAMCRWCGAHTSEKHKRKTEKLCGIAMSPSWIEAAKKYGA